MFFISFIYFFNLNKVYLMFVLKNGIFLKKVDIFMDFEWFLIVDLYIFVFIYFNFYKIISVFVCRMVLFKKFKFF